MKTGWGGWLPWNRRWQTEAVSLADAASPRWQKDRLDESIRYHDAEIHCYWCGEFYTAGTGPDWPAGYCTQVCVNAARRDLREQAS